MEQASQKAIAKYEQEIAGIRQEHKADPDALKRELQQHSDRHHGRLNTTHYRSLKSDWSARVAWNYGGAKYAWNPTSELPETPDVSDSVVVIPPGQKLIVELGDRIPEIGMLRVRVRASRTSEDNEHVPSLQLEFGWQASNDSQASVRISKDDLVVEAPSGEAQFYEWTIPLRDVYPRNSVRHISKMGDLPSPSEYLKLVNSTVSQGDIQVDYIEVSAPVYEQWPPESHRRIFFSSENREDENAYAREVLESFMTRAWRRPVSVAEVSQKLDLFTKIRPQCADFQEAMVEVLAAVLSSPQFLYLVQETAAEEEESRLTQYELATRLSMFLWCSTPDDKLMELAGEQQLNNPDILVAQIDRMIADPRSQRFSEQFIRQWLGLQLLDFLNVDRKLYPRFNQSLKDAMQREPVAFFEEMLKNNSSVMDFLHADYTMANERLAKHYGLENVVGNHFRRVSLPFPDQRGGLLTQAGLLAMNSDGKDSHPLKRGIWMLERLLNDPPPPPPPAVPVIDLADPEIARLTLKERIENHRDQAACRSCHRKIDPWGIAFENFDAIGSWRSDIQGKPVDATSELFNGQKLDGIAGLKRYLLEHRQDQFARAIVYKMTTFALGRPLTFGDRVEIDQLTADLRHQDDGLVTLIKLIAGSDLFQMK